MSETNKTRIESYVEQAKSVIDWNAMQYAGEPHPFRADDKIGNQIDYIQSEAKEIIEGIEMEDAREFLDGICDVFVTVSYLPVLLRADADVHPHEVARLVIERAMSDGLGFVHQYAMSAGLSGPGYDHHHLIGCFHGLAETIEGGKCYQDTLPNVAMAICLMAENRFPGLDVAAAIAKVMASNWSKYPLESELLRSAEDECRWIEANRNQADVKYITYQNRIVFRNKGGTGKIMKPSTFVEPEFSESDVALIKGGLFNTSDPAIQSW